MKRITFTLIPGICLKNSSITFTLILLFLASAFHVGATTATVSGNWSNTATWGGDPVPTSADAVFINSAVNVIMDVPFGECLSLTINSNTTGYNGLTISGTNTLTVGSGGIIMTMPIVHTSTIDVGAGTLTVNGTISIPGSSTATLNNILSVSTGTINCNALTFSGSAGQAILDFNDAGTLNVGFGTTGTISANTLGTIIMFPGNTINYNGAAQTLRGMTYNFLSLSGTGVKTMTGTTAINNDLKLSGSATAATVGNTSVGGDLTIGDGTAFTTAFNLSVAGATTVGGGVSGFYGIVDNPVISHTGGISYGSTGSTLSYSGTTASRNTGSEWPALNPPDNVILNKSGFALNLTGLRTVGTNLTVSAGTLNDGGFVITGPGTGSGTFTLSGTSVFTMNNNDINPMPSFQNYTISATSTINYAGNGPQNIPATPASYGNVAFTNNTKTLQGSFTVSGSFTNNTATVITDNSNNYTITAAGNVLSDGSITGETRVLLDGGTAHNISGVGTYRHLELNDATGTLNGITNVSGNLIITSGVFSTAALNIAVQGSTSIATGTSLTHGASGTKTFNDITNNGTWTGGGTAFLINGSLSNNGAFTSGAGLYTFAGSGKTISGNATALSFTAATVTGTYITSHPNLSITTLNINSPGTFLNSGSLTVATTLGGTGSFTNGDGLSGTLTFGGTIVGVTSFDASTCPNTVIYNLGGAQTVKAVTYCNLTINKNAGTIATIATPGITVSSTLRLQAGILADAGFSISGGGSSTILVDDLSANILRLGSATVATGFPLGFSTITLGQNSWVEYISTIAGQVISAVPVYGSLLMSTASKTDLGATITVKGNVTNNTTIAGGGKIVMSGIIAQTITGSTSGFNQLEFSNGHASGVTFANTAGITSASSINVVSGLVSLAAFTTSLNVSGSTTVSGQLNITNTTGAKNLAATTINNGASINVSVGATASMSDFTINNGGTWLHTVGGAITITGNIINNGTFTSPTGAGTYTFNSGSLKTITGTGAMSVFNLTIGATAGTVYESNVPFTILGTLTVNPSTTLTNKVTMTASNAGVGVLSTGTLINDAGATLFVAATSIAPALTATGAGNTIEYNGAGTQTMKPTSYVNLRINKTLTTQTATLGGATSISGDLNVMNGILADGTNIMTAPHTGTFTISGTGTFTMTNATANPFPAIFSAYSFAPTSTVNYNGAIALQNISAVPSPYGNLSLASSTKQAAGAFTVAGLFTIGASAGFNDNSFIITANAGIANTAGHTSTSTGKILLSGGTSHSLTGAGAYGNLELNDAVGATAGASFAVNGVLTQTSGIFTVGGTFTLTLAGTLAGTGGSFAGAATLNSNLNITGTGALGETLKFDQTGTNPNLGLLTMNRTTSGVVNLGSPLTLNAATGLTLTNGLLVLGSNNLTFANASFSGAGSATSFVVADVDVNTGEMRKIFNIGSTTAMNFAIGDNTGTAEYSPVTITPSLVAGSNKTIGLRVRDAAHANNNNGGAPVDYATRYWTFSESAGGTYSYIAAFTFINTASDVAGLAANYKVNRYDNVNAVWQQLTSTSSGAVITATPAVANTVAALSGDFGLRNEILQPYTWIGADAIGGDGDWTNPAHWSPARYPLSSDTIRFVLGGNPIVSNVPTQTIRQLLVTSNTNPTLTSSAAGQTLSIVGLATPAISLSIESGSSLTLGSTTPTFTLQLATTTNQLGNIAGTLNVNTGNVFSAAAITVAPGVTIASGGIINSNGGQVTGAGLTGLTFAAGSFYNHNSNGLTLPVASWNAASTCTIASTTTPPTALATQTFGNLTIATGAGVTTSMAATITVAGNLSINSGTFSDGGLQIVGNGANNLSVANGATLQLGVGTGTTEAFPTLFTTAKISLGATSTVNYNTTGAQPVAGPVTGVGPNTYGNLTLTGTAGTKSLTGAITVAGNLTVATSGETFSDGGFQITGNNTGGSLSVAAGATLQIGAATAAITTFPTLYPTANISLPVTSTVNYNTITNPQTVAASIAGAGPSTYGNLTVTGATTKTVAGPITVAGNLNIATAAEILADGGNIITIKGNITSVGTHSGAGKIYLNGGAASHTLTGTPAVYGNLELDDVNGANLSSTGTTVVSGNLAVTTGNLTLGAITLTVNGTTTVAPSTSLILSNATGTKTFTGDVTINGTWNNTSNSTATMNGNLIVNTGATFTAGTGIYTFGGATKFIQGTIASLSIPNLTVTGTYTNNIPSLTVGTGLAGAGTLTMGGSTVLNLGGTTTITGLNCTANTPNKVVYNGAGVQTTKNSATTYYDLEINKPVGQVATLGAATAVNNNLDITSGTLADGTFIMTTAHTGTFTISGTGTFTMTNATANPFPAIFTTYSFAPSSTVNYNGAIALQNISPVPSPYGNLSLASSTKQAAGAFTIAGLFSIGTSAGFNDNSFTITANAGIANTAGHTSTTSGKILLTGGTGHSLTGAGAYGNLELNDPAGAIAGATFAVNGVLTQTSGNFTIGGGFTLTLGGTLAGTGGSFAGAATLNSNLTIAGTGSLGSTLRFDQTGTNPNLGLLTMSRTSSGVVNLGSALTLNAATGLTLSSGLLFLGNNNLSFGPTSVSGTVTAGSFVVADADLGTGELRKTFNTGATAAMIFPIGDNTGTAEYSPVTITPSAVAGSAKTIGVRVRDAVHGNMNNGGAPADYASRYWTFSESVGGTYSYIAAFTFLNTASDLAAGTAANYKVNRYDIVNAVWQQLTSTSAAPVITATPAVPSTVAALSSDFALRNEALQPYTWIGADAIGGDGDWTNPGHWSPARYPLATDTIRFALGGSPIVSNVPTQTISQLLVTANTSPTLTSSAAGQTLSISGVASPALNFFIESGSSLTLGSSTPTFTLQFSTPVNQLGNIAGTLNVNSGNVFSVAALTTAPGVTIANGGIINSNGGQVTGASASAGLIFAAGSFYNHNGNGLVIPTASWNATSTCTIASPTTGPSGGVNQIFGNLTIASGASVQVAMNGSTTVSTNLNLNSGLFVLGANGLILNGAVNSSGGLLSGISTSSLTISGSTPASIGSIGFVTGSRTLGTFTINRSGSTLNLTSPLTVTTLALSNGIIDNDVNLLTIASGGSFSGGSTGAHVSGPLARIIPPSSSGATFVFPVGKGGSYNPFEIISPVTSATAGGTTVRAEVFDFNPGGSAGSGVASISGASRFWESHIVGTSTLTSKGNVRVTDATVGAGKVLAQSDAQNGSFIFTGETVSGSTIASINLAFSDYNFFVVGDKGSCGDFTVENAASLLGVTAVDYAGYITTGKKNCWYFTGAGNPISVVYPSSPFPDPVDMGYPSLPIPGHTSTVPPAGLTYSYTTGTLPLCGSYFTLDLGTLNTATPAIGISMQGPSGSAYEVPGTFLNLASLSLTGTQLKISGTTKTSYINSSGVPIPAGSEPTIDVRATITLGGGISSWTRTGNIVSAKINGNFTVNVLYEADLGDWTNVLCDNNTEQGGCPYQSCNALSNCSSRTQNMYVPINYVFNSMHSRNGGYIFEATWGRVYETFDPTWVLGPPPTITVQPTTPPAVCSGTGTQTLSVTAIGNDLTYVWKRNGIPVTNGTVGATTISGQGTTTLAITNPVYGINDSVYTVEISGAPGCVPAPAISDPVTVNINTSPNITVQPVAPSPTCSGTGTQEISVTATGANLTYSWRKAGVPLVNNTVFSGQGTATLTLTNPTTLDAASYDVAISGTCTPPVVSNAVVVTISTAPDIILQPVAPADVCSGLGTQTIGVLATGTALTYSWRKDGFAVTNGGIYSGQGTNQLTLTYPQVSDGGSYDVFISGTCSPDQTSTAVMAIINPNPEVPTIAGSAADFSTSFCGSGFLTATVGQYGTTCRWYKGNPSTFAGATLIGTGTLSPTFTASGIYFVSSYNAATGCESSAQPGNSGYIAITITVTPTFSITSLTSPSYSGGYNIKCNGGATGEATVVTNSVATPIKYFWSNGQTSQTATNMAAGSYNVFIIDNSGCQNSGTILLNEAPALNLVLTPSSFSGDGTNCAGSSTGSVSSTTTGGSPSFSYTWSSTPMGFSSTDADILNIPANTYNLTVTDANSCSISASQVISDPSPIIFTTSVGFVCSGSTYVSATATISASGGSTGTFEYAMDGGTFQTSNQFFGLADGSSHTFKVRDAAYPAYTCETTGPTVDITLPASGTTIGDCNFIYVTTDGDASSFLGTKNCPTTLQNAYTIFAGNPTRNHILMQAGVYSFSTKLSVPANVTIDGGYDVNWVKSSLPGATTVAINSALENNGNIGYYKGIEPDAGANGFTLRDITFNVRTGGATGTFNNVGITIYGLYISGQTGFKISRCTITTGLASKGNNGATNTAAGGGYSAGGGGFSGTWSDCHVTNYPVGSPCGGGNGCSNCPTCGRGLNGASGGGPLGGSGGGGANYCCSSGCNTVGCGASGCNAGSGAVGNNGGGGASIAPATASLNASLFTPVNGAVGNAGSGGGGGGGGGAGEGGTCCTTSCGCGNAFGGRGGDGGQGGAGGAGGYGSGGSFAIYAWGGSGTITDTKLNVGAAVTRGIGAAGRPGIAAAGNQTGGVCRGGGDGGCGGNGGRGGAGGTGGAGQDGSDGISQKLVQLNGASLSWNFDGVPANGTITANWYSGCRNSEIIITKTQDNWSGIGASGANPGFINNLTSSTSSYSSASNTAGIYYSSSATTGVKNLSTTGSAFTNFIEVKSDRLVTGLSNSMISVISSPCPGASITLSNTLSAAQKANIDGYDWAITLLSSPTTNVYTSSAADPGLVNPPIGGWDPNATYQVRLRLHELCCGWSIPLYTIFIVGAVPLNAGPITPGDPIVCANQNGAVYSISAVPGASNYTWTVSGGTIASAQGSTSLTVNWNGAGTGIVSVLPSNLCGSAVSSTSLSVPINTNPTVNISAAPSATVCQGTSITLSTSATAGTGGNLIFSYLWSNGSTAASIISNVSNTRSVTVTEGSSNCSASATQVVTVNPLPTIVVASSGTQSCKNPTASNSSLTYGSSTNSPIGYLIEWNAAASLAGMQDEFVSTYSFSPIGGTIPVAVYANVSPGTYTATLTVFNANGCNSIGSNFTVTVIENLPPVSTSGTLDGTGCSSFTAHWNSISTATGYIIETSLNNFFGVSGGILATYTVGDVTSLSITGTAGVTYYYRVRSISCGSPSVTTSAVQIVVMNPAAPVANIANAGSNINCTSFTAIWQSSANATRYNLYVYSNSALTTLVAGYPLTVGASVFSASVTDLNPGQDYYYRVVAENDCGSAGFSNTIAVHTSDPAATPTVAAASALDCQQFRANWNQANFATSYFVDVSTTPLFNSFIPGWEHNPVGNTTTSLVVGLTMGGTYYYRVQADNDCNVLSAQSGITTVTLFNIPTLLSCPGDIELNNDESRCDATVVYNPAIATGTPAPEYNYSQASGTIFSVGTTTVTVDIYNQCGHVTPMCTFDITVYDAEPPTVFCPVGQFVELDENCFAELQDYRSMAQVSDNCAASPANPSLPPNQQPPNTISLTQDPAPGLSLGVGTTTVTITATDAFGNHNACNFDVIVQDLIAPTAVYTDLTVYLNASGSAHIIADDDLSGTPFVNTGSYDNCGPVTVSVYPDAFDCSQVNTTQTVTFQVDDINGNSTFVPVAITVLDVISPSVTPPADVTLNCEDDLGSGSTGIATGEDNCVDVNISESDVSTQDPDPSTIGHYNYYITRTWTATDGSLNSTSADQIITVQDVTAPTVTLPADATVNCQEDYSSGSTGEATGLDNCSDVVISESEVSSQDPDPSTPGYYNYTIVRTWTATDVSGNSTSLDQYITVQDITSPAVYPPFDITVNCEDDMSSGSLGIAMGEDNCDQNVIITEGESSTQDPDVAAWGHYNYSIIRTWTATDASGNSSSLDQIITVQDVTSPNVYPPADVTISCEDDENSSSTGIATGDDNCDQNVLITESDVSTQDGDVYSLAHYNYTITRTWTATDVTGNSSSLDQIITVQDITNPSVTPPTDVTVSCEDDNSSATTGVATGADNCSDVVISESDASSQDGDPSSTGHYNYTITRTWTATDVTGNSSSSDQIITVQDITDPTVYPPSAITVNCDGDMSSAVTGVATGDDNCDLDVAITESDASNQDPDPSAPEHYNYTITRTWTATDASGNSSDANQIITVQDITNPSVTPPADITVSCEDNNSSAATGIATGTDNCSDVAITEADASTQHPDPGNAGHYNYTITRTWTATDVSGNSSSMDQIISVIDVTNPSVTIPANATVSCDHDNSSTVTGIATGVDNCSDVIITEVDASTQDPNPLNAGHYNYTITRTWTSTDVSGNYSSDDQIITVINSSPPVALTNNFTTSLDATGTVRVYPQDIDAGSHSICGGPVTLMISGSSPGPYIDFFCSEVGANNVLLWVTDESGNISSAPAVVTIVDDTPPVALCKGITIQLDHSGSASIVPADIDNGSNDACGILSRAVSESSFTCADFGPNTITLTVTDVNHNVTTCQSIVTVEDHVQPDANCQNITIQLDHSGNASIASADINNNSTDACGILSFAVSQSSFNCTHVSPSIPNVVTLTVTDIHGNVNTCNSTITVQDQVVPDALCRSVTTQLDDFGSASVFATQGEGSPYINDNSYDACGIASMVLDTTKYGCNDVGSHTVILTVTDVNGNASSCTATVLVQDKILPTTLCQGVTIDLDGAGTGTVTPAQLNNGSYDNCGIASYQAIPNTFNCSNLGFNPVVLKIIDLYGNEDTCISAVTVRDSIRPTITCPPDTAVTALQFVCNKPLTIAAPVVHDNCTIVSVLNSFNGSSNGSGTYPGDYPNTKVTDVLWTVTDQSGNFKTCHQIVTVYPCITIGTNLLGTVYGTICPGECNGSITVSMPGVITGGSAPFAYTWSNGQTTQNLAALCAGNYCVTITDASSGSGTACFTVGTIIPYSEPIRPDTISWNDHSVPQGNAWNHGNHNGWNHHWWNHHWWWKRGGPIYVCPGIDTFSIAPVPLANYYEWEVPNNASIVAGQGTTEIIVSWNSSFNGGDVKVKALNCVGASQSVSIRVNRVSSPNHVDITGPNQVCPNSTVTYFNDYSLRDSITMSPLSYAWIMPANASIVSGAGTNTITVYYNSSFSGGTIYLNASNCSGVDNDVLNISLATSAPSISGLRGDDKVCPGDIETYSVDISNGAATYTWTAPINSVIVSGQGTATVVISFNSNFAGGTVSVRGSNCRGISGALNKNISLQDHRPDKPSWIQRFDAAFIVTYGGHRHHNNNFYHPNHLFDSRYACPGDTVEYVADDGHNQLEASQTWVWTAPAGATIIGGQGTNEVSIVYGSGFTGGNVSVYGHNCVGNSDAKTMAVSLPPLPVIRPLIGYSRICNGFIYPYRVQADYAESITWLVPAGSIILDGQGTSDILVQFPSNFVSGNITAYATNCSGNSAVTTFQVSLQNQIPTNATDIQGPSSICQGGGIASYSTGAGWNNFPTAFTWSVPANAVILAGQSSANVTVQFLGGFAGGNITVYASNCVGASAIRSKAVAVNALPVCTITATKGGTLWPNSSATAGALPNTLFLGYGYSNMTLATPAGSGYSFAWTQTGPITTGLNCNACANPVFTPSVAGNYTFTVVKTNSSTGCSNTCTISICVLDVRVPATTQVYTCKAGITTAMTTSTVAAYLASNPTARLGSCSTACGVAKSDDEEITQDFNVRVYPNPFSDQFHLIVSSSSYENLEIRIFDVLGQMVDDKREIAYTSDITFGSTLARGVYLIEVKQGDRLEVLRVVKSE